MEYYVVKFTETLARKLVVRADNEDEALKKAHQAYDNDAVILDYDDYDEYEIEVLREASKNEVMYYDILEVEE